MRVLESGLGVCIILLSWFALADLGDSINPILLPPLRAVLKQMWRSALDGELGRNTYATVSRVLWGLAIGILLGSLLGFAIGASAKLYRMTELPLEFLRALPATALFPFFLMFFGLGDESKIALVALPTALLMLLNTYYGVQRASGERKRMARVFGGSGAQVFFRVILFEALPQMAIGIRLSLSMALVVAIASEMFIGTEIGIGQRIFDAYLTSSSASVFAYVIVAGLLGYAFNKVAIASEQHFIFWSGK